MDRKQRRSLKKTTPPVSAAELQMLFQQALRLHQLGQLTEAETLYRRILTLSPQHADSLHLLGLLTSQLGRNEAAITLFKQAIAINGQVAAYHLNHGNALRNMGRLGEAVQAYDEAIRLKPDYAMAYSNRGNSLIDLGRSEDALASFDQALRLKPDYAEALSNRASILTDLGRAEEALASIASALALGANFAEAHYNHGNALRQLGRVKDSVASYRRAIELQPDYPQAKGMLALTLRHVCDWSDQGACEADIVQMIRQGRTGIAPFLLCASPQASADDALKAARLWGQTFERTARLSPASPSTERRIRIGYLSSDLREHPVAVLAVELLERHDRSRFDVFAYSTGPDDESSLRRRIERGVEHFIDIASLSQRDAAERIRADGIHILIDLNGYTTMARTQILAMRPAPIQVNFLGYPGSMGVDFVDYLIGDPVVTPFESQPFFQEKIVQLPHCYQPNDRQRKIAGTAPDRADCGLPERGFVFCCFNNSLKLSSELFTIWMRLLQAQPDSVLWLLDCNDVAKRNLQREAEAQGIDPARLVFAPRLPIEQHLARHSLADLFLDSFPYNAHTTASDALWAGLPLVTLAGETFPSRVAASLLTAVGLPELITHRLADYEKLALALAKDPERMAQLKAKLAALLPTAPLFDTLGYVRHLEAAFERMWMLWRDGNQPESFRISAQDPAQGA